MKTAEHCYVAKIKQQNFHSLILYATESLVRNEVAGVARKGKKVIIVFDTRYCYQGMNTENKRTS